MSKSFREKRGADFLYKVKEIRPPDQFKRTVYYSTVTDFARFLGLSTSQPLRTEA